MVHLRNSGTPTRLPRPLITLPPRCGGPASPSLTPRLSTCGPRKLYPRGARGYAYFVMGPRCGRVLRLDVMSTVAVCRQSKRQSNGSKAVRAPPSLGSWPIGIPQCTGSPLPTHSPKAPPSSPAPPRYTKVATRPERSRRARRRPREGRGAASSSRPDFRKKSQTRLHPASDASSLWG